MRIINYFRNLLFELELINNHLKKIEKHLEKISSCVNNDNYRHKNSISTGHWND